MIRNIRIPTLAKYFLNKTPQLHLVSSVQLGSFTKQNNLVSLNSKPFFCMSSQVLHKNQMKSNYSGPGFYIEQLHTGCLAIYSYYIESDNECFLVDPLFDIS